jgi:hypothetical protein
MIFLEHLFNLSIVIIIFNLVWGILVKIPEILLTGLKPSKPINYILSGLKYFLLSNLIYTNSLNSIQESAMSINQANITYLLGGFILFLYLAGKLNKKKSMLSLISSVGFNSKFKYSNSKLEKLKYENHIAGISIIIYTASVGFPIFGEIMTLNPLNIWFNNTIQGLYQTPLLKGIFGVFGIFFMISTLQKGISTIKQLFFKVTGFKNKENDTDLLKKEVKNPFQEMKDKTEKSKIENDIYVDFEEIDDKENNL